jgi:hypothetical protein
MTTRRLISSRRATEPSVLVLFKYWQAFLALAMAVALGPTPPLRLVISIPLALWGLFSLTIAEVRASEEVLEYRRFLKWKGVPYETIQECKRSLIPVLGYLKLGSVVPPWGKIYFVSARPIFDHGPDQIVPYVNARMRRREFPMDMETESLDARRQAGRRWALAFATGIMCSLVVYYLFPNFPTTPSWVGYPSLIRVTMHIWEKLVTWPWGIVTAAVLSALSFRDRSAKRSWILAAAIGFMLVEMALVATR